MAMKLYEVIELAEQHSKELSQSPINWMGYMDTASRVYKYTFKDSLLIHAQKPSATACAEIGLWNDRMGRWVNRGAKGIALIDETGARKKLRYVFDVKDTHLGRGGKTPSTWFIGNEIEGSIKEYLTYNYDLEEENTNTLSDALFQIAANYTYDYLDDTVDELYSKTNYEGDTDSTAASLRVLMINSSYYMLARRCGLDPMKVLDLDSFRDISLFNDTESLAVVGDAVHDIVEPVLRDIEKEVKVVLKEYYTERNRKSFERREQEKETARKELQTADILQKNDGTQEPEKAVEDTGQGIKPDEDIHPEQEISDPEAEKDGEAEGEYEIISLEEEEKAEEEVTEQDLENKEAAEMLDLPNLPTAQEQKWSIEKAASYDPFGSYSVPEEVVNEILRSGSNNSRSQLRIAVRYMADIPREERVRFLKEEYREGGKGYIIDGEKYATWFDEAGIAIAKGDNVQESENPVYYLTWEETEERLHDLIENGEYAPKPILDAAYLNSVKETATALTYMEREVDPEVSRVIFYGIEDKFSHIYPETEEAVMRYIETPEGLKDMLERVEALKIAYDQDGTVMRSGLYNPERLLNSLELLDLSMDKKLPFRESFNWNWNNYDIFITQDEIDRFLGSGGPYSDSKLTTYSYFLMHDDLKDRTEFIKEHYGTGGRFPALSGADHSGADYNSKGLKLSRGKSGEGNKRASVELNWNKVARRIDHLIKADRFMSAKDYERMPVYERTRMGAKVISFFSRMPGDIKRPIEFIDKSEISDYWEIAKTIGERFEDLTERAELLKIMEEAIAQLPLDFNEYDTNYEEKAKILSDVHGYAEGSFTLFPVKSLGNELKKEESRQLNLFDLMEKAEVESIEEQEPDTKSEKTIEDDRTEAVYITRENNYLEMHQTDDGEWDFDLYHSDLNPLDGGRYGEGRDLSLDEAKEEILSIWGYDTADLRELSIEKWEELKRIKEENQEIDLSEYSQDQKDVIETARREGKDISRLLDPEYSPEQMQLILDLTERAEAESRANFEHIFRDVTEVHLNIDEINRIRRDNNLPLEKLRPNKESGRSNAVGGEGIFSGVRIIDGGVDKETGLRSTIIDLRGDYEEQTEVIGEKKEFTPNNFKITDDELGTGGPKAKFRANMEAINLLKTLEDEERHAAPEEQEILSRYVGWGGLSKAFDPEAKDWEEEYREVKAALSPEEYREARESTLSAFYTPPVVIKAMYETLERMGLNRGNILEPSCGVGNFMGLMPDSMSDTKMYGVELDSISGRIAKELYQKNKVYVQGFEETEFPDSFFDCVVGNVPFGQFKVNDKRYDRYNFLIHDYFIARSLDLTRPGGVVAVLTSKGTMDKKGEEVRQYIADRAELLGAVRLPNNTFKGNAGTEAVSDILFLKKRDGIAHSEDSWIRQGSIYGENGDIYTVNQYFAEHPEMILGDLSLESTQYGRLDVTVNPKEGEELKDQLREALSNITGTIEETEISVDDLEDEGPLSIEADLNVKNYSFTNVDGEVYYRENSRMYYRDLTRDTASRVLGMIRIRDTLKELFEAETGDSSDSEIEVIQNRLNKEYDTFTAQYGLIRSKANQKAFREDSSYYLLTALEDIDEEGNFKGKADIFSKRTIRKAEPVTSVDTASEALAVSIGEKAEVDLPFMAALTGKSESEITEELKGVIFKNPETEKYENYDEYLSGNVRNKLRTARRYAQTDPEFEANVEYLEKVQPKELDASEIEVRLGATWIDPKYIERFMHEEMDTPWWLLGRGIKVNYAKINGTWNISGKGSDYGNAKVYSTYGTDRINGYKLLEDTLNLKEVKIYDTIEDEEGKEKRVLNKKETIIAQQKQELLREAFKEWIFKDITRREELTKKYNELFNSVRPREYDGSHIRFNGMTDDVELRPHQLNAVAHILYGDNTLLAHTVGAGKTYDMIAAGMESRRLGLANKCLYVVPNHLTEQWGSDFLKLYPGANILVATKKDFEPANRKKFCSRIATGDYDAVIMGHTQFEKIPLSIERQKAVIQEQIDDITNGIAELKRYRGDSYNVKQMEKTRKNLVTSLNKINDQKRKDDVVTFEQLGVDRLFVDESHNFKNLFLYTKMNNVAGISQTNAQKSFDMFMKCRYMDEITGGKGITFATGTPISNSMVELYTVMRYLQYDTLKDLELEHFDAWASSFGETVTAIELAPEGTGYRAKTRFARFYNLPELISLFKEAADVQTADMLNLPVPEAEYINETIKPSEIQKDMVSTFSERAEAVRTGYVNPKVDNMLKITNDGRKLALDQRLMNDILPDEEDSKVNRCVKNVYDVWKESEATLGTQLVFCDLSTPKADGSFNVYDDIREKLVGKGIPKEEIAFIHEANTEAKKAELFEKVRKGKVRILLGSTPKLGAGTNVQDKLIALHHLDCPWKPSDLEQQEGRILRQGNTNPKVKIFRYVTEGTFDAYMWQILENKQKFISQIMTSKSPVRSCEDVDDTALSYAEIKALATGNPHIKEKMDLDIQVSKLKLTRANFISSKYRMESDIARKYPAQIAALRQRIENLESDFEHVKPLLDRDKEHFRMTVSGKEYIESKDAGSAIIQACAGMRAVKSEGVIGNYEGFDLIAGFDTLNQAFTLTLKRQASYTIEIGKDPVGNIRRINNVLNGIENSLIAARNKLETVEGQLKTAKEEVMKSFPQEEELREKIVRLNELNSMLNMDERDYSGTVGVDEDAEDDAERVITEQATVDEIIVPPVSYDDKILRFSPNQTVNESLAEYAAAHKEEELPGFRVVLVTGEYSESEYRAMNKDEVVNDYMNHNERKILKYFQTYNEAVEYIYKELKETTGAVIADKGFDLKVTHAFVENLQYDDAGDIITIDTGYISDKPVEYDPFGRNVDIYRDDNGDVHIEFSSKYNYGKFHGVISTGDSKYISRTIEFDQYLNNVLLGPYFKPYLNNGLSLSQVYDNIADNLVHHIRQNIETDLGGIWLTPEEEVRIESFLKKEISEAREGTKEEAVLEAFKEAFIERKLDLDFEDNIMSIRESHLRQTDTTRGAGDKDRNKICDKGEEL